MKHQDCGAEVKPVTREILTVPQDKSWPINVTLELPFCPTCQRLVHLSELETRS